MDLYNYLSSMATSSTTLSFFFFLFSLLLILSHAATFDIVNRFFVFLFSLLLILSYAATFDIVNRCSYTVWAAAVPGGGRKLNPGQSWIINVNAGPTGGRIWARTGCNFDGSGRGSCQTGDCDGLLQCCGYGTPPNTLAEFTLNQVNNLDFFDISNMDGFNVPMDFSPTTTNCSGIRCAADIVGQCPAELRAPGGCNDSYFCSRRISTAATREAAGRRTTRDSSRGIARKHIVIPRMMPRAPSPAPPAPTTRWSSAGAETQGQEDGQLLPLII